MRLHPRWSEAAVVTAAGVLGLILNRFGISILPDVGLFFGGIFYLVVALRFGPMAGATAAVVSGLTLAPHFGWPVLPMVAAEAFTVGAMARRGNPGAIGGTAVLGDGGHADHAFGLHRNPPLSVAGLLGIHRHSAAQRFLQRPGRPVPGNAARESAIWAARRAAPSARCRCAAIFRSASPRLPRLPLLLVTVVSGRLYVDRQYNDARDYSAEAAFAIRENIDAVVVRHLSAVQALAGSLAAGRRSPARMLNHWLAGVAQVYPDFQDLLWPTAAATCWAQAPGSISFIGCSRRPPARPLSSFAALFRAPVRWSRT